MKSRVLGALFLAGVMSTAGPAFPAQQQAHEDIYNAVATPDSGAAPANVPVYAPPQGVVRFSSGPFITHPGGGFGGADASVLQQAAGMTIFGFTASSAAAIRLADDFVVPAGQSWRVNQIIVYAYQTNAIVTNPSPISAANIQIWNGVPEAAGSTIVFGDLTTNRLVSSTFSNVYRALESTPLNAARGAWANRVSIGQTFGPGTYWIDWQVTGSPAFGGPFVPPVTILGTLDTGNAMQKVGTAAFVALLDGTHPQGIPFLLLGPRPAALAISGGNTNGVIEPAETVGVEPAWRGGVIADTNVTGTAVGNADFVLTDLAAAYGTLPIDTVASCTAATNCYAGTAGATRPTTHWDAAMTETLTNGDVWVWPLHIGASFTDVPTTNIFYRFVETILHRNVTGGCTTTTYCPGASTTREQMSVFVLVSKDPLAAPPAACVAGSERFTDVPASSPFCRWIEELERRGVVTGCTANTYCPTAPASREQMSVFVLRTLDPTLNPPACAPPNLYTDVPETSPFCRWIEELTVRGVVTGCGGGNYCPTADVTRDQMAVFLTGTFSLTLYGPS